VHFPAYQFAQQSTWLTFLPVNSDRVVDPAIEDLTRALQARYDLALLSVSAMAGSEPITSPSNTTAAPSPTQAGMTDGNSWDRIAQRDSLRAQKIEAGPPATASTASCYYCSSIDW
jgi:hypothetical protein